MSESFTSGSVGGAAGNRRFYPAADLTSFGETAVQNAKSGYDFQGF
jgi:hypothetical protein